MGKCRRFFALVAVLIMFFAFCLTSCSSKKHQDVICSQWSFYEYSCNGKIMGKESYNITGRVMPTLVVEEDGLVLTFDGVVQRGTWTRLSDKTTNYDIVFNDGKTATATILAGKISITQKNVLGQTYVLSFTQD